MKRLIILLIVTLAQVSLVPFAHAQDTSFEDRESYREARITNTAITFVDGIVTTIENQSSPSVGWLQNDYSGVCFEGTGSEFFSGGEPAGLSTHAAIGASTMANQAFLDDLNNQGNDGVQTAAINPEALNIERQS